MICCTSILKVRLVKNGFRTRDFISLPIGGKKVILRMKGASVSIADACGSRIKVPTECAAVGESGEQKEVFARSARRKFAGDEDVGFDPAELVGVHLVEAARVAGVEGGVA